MKYGIMKKEIQGRFTTYTELTSQAGYCFYDADDEERNYLTSIMTPITDEAELERKYVVVQGDADKLNDELQKQRELENSQSDV